MTSLRSTPARPAKLLLGLVVCACFLLQPLLVPLHLALHEHVDGLDSGHHAHDDGHPADDEHDGHEPHPEGEHLDEFAKPARLPSAPQPALIPRGNSWAGVALALLHVQDVSSVSEPAPQPPRGNAPARAPPARS